jgi:hopanoid biosynthesis associated RND transporter like protein HpnN
MIDGFERLLGGVAAAVVETSTRRPRLVLALSVLLTAASAMAAAGLKVDTDSDRLLSADLRVGQTNRALAAAFPDLQNNLVVMVEADDPADARAAAEALRARLAAEPERYQNLFLPGYGDYYDDFGLYHLDRDELDELAARIEEAGPLLATLAERPELPVLLGALAHVVESADGLASLGDDGRRILQQVTRAVERFNAGEHAPIAWDELLFEDRVGGWESPQLLFVRPVGDLTQLAPVLDAIRAIRGLARGLEPRPGLRVRVTGDRAVHSEEMSLIIGEATLAGLASLVLVTLVLLLALRSVRLVLATLLTLLVGLAWTAGLARVAVGHLNALTSAFAVLYIGLGVDFGIHFALGFLERRKGGRAIRQALHGTGASVGSSLLLCAVTTATGFYAFVPTNYSAVADMGIISGSGVLLGLLATLILYPALLALGAGRSEGQAHAPGSRLEVRLPSFPTRHPRAVCGAAAVVTLACCGALAWVRFDPNHLNVRDPRVESVQALGDLLLDSDLSVWTIEVLTRGLDEARALTAQLEALPGVDHVNTIEGFLPKDQDERLAIFRRMRADLTTPVELRDDETGAGLDRLTAFEYTIEGYGVALDIDAELRGGDEDGLVAEAERLRGALLVLHGRLQDEESPPDVEDLERDVFRELGDVLRDVAEALPARTVTLADLPDDLKRRYLAEDGRARVEVFSRADLSQPGALERFSAEIHALRPDAGGPAAGTVALARAIVDSLRQALATALVVIAILLLALWRSFKYTLITLTPLAVGSVATAAASVVADIPFNFANIIVLPLILGIGVDSGIHLVHRHRLRRDENLLATSTAHAVLFSALTTGVSFATLAFSNHLGIASLGQMLSVGIGLMLAANVVVLPAILTLVDAQRSDR